MGCDTTYRRPIPVPGFQTHRGRGCRLRYKRSSQTSGTRTSLPMQTKAETCICHHLYWNAGSERCWREPQARRSPAPEVRAVESQQQQQQRIANCPFKQQNARQIWKRLLTIMIKWLKTKPYVEEINHKCACKTICTDLGDHDKLTKEAREAEEEEETFPPARSAHHGRKHVRDGCHHHLHSNELYGPKKKRQKAEWKCVLLQQKKNESKLLCVSYLCVQAQENEHDKETDGPHLRQRHHGHGLRVRDEGQTRTWRDKHHTGSSSTACLQV